MHAHSGDRTCNKHVKFLMIQCKYMYMYYYNYHNPHRDGVVLMG